MLSVELSHFGQRAVERLWDGTSSHTTRLGAGWEELAYDPRSTDAALDAGTAVIGRRRGFLRELA